MKILVFDNYDSFTYNLVHIIRELGYGSNIDVVRNDKIKIEEVAQYDKILLSPGPGVPRDAGIMEDLIREYGEHKSILGICLGHQGIAEVYGARLFNMPIVLHGITTESRQCIQDYVFEGIPNEIKVCRYHSWAVAPESINGNLEVTATDNEGTIMALRHRKFDVRGIQFHPEAYKTEYGKQMILNWIRK